jgi:hypothetical protein
MIMIRPRKFRRKITFGRRNAEAVRQKYSRRVIFMLKAGGSRLSVPAILK